MCAINLTYSVIVICFKFLLIQSYYVWFDNLFISKYLITYLKKKAFLLQVLQSQILEFQYP